MKKFAFVVQMPPFKSENPKLALTHSLASFVAGMHIDDEITASVSFVGDGVLNCVKGQKSEQFYNLGSNEKHIKNMLASDMKVMACREDLEKFGISHERLIDAKDMGAETAIKAVPFEEILKEIEECDQVMFF